MESSHIDKTDPLAPLPPLADGLTREFLRHHRVCPMGFGTNPSRLLVAATDDSLLAGSIGDISVAYGRPVEISQTDWATVEALIERLCTGSDRAIELSRSRAAAYDDSMDVRDLASQAPVVRFVNLLIRDAYDTSASDVHLDATPDGLRARFRIDGVLVPAPEPIESLATGVVSRIKLLAELDVAERRRPQDGRIRVRLEKQELDLRVSTVPTAFGESVVLRLLDGGGRPTDLSELGMAPAILKRVERLAARPYGLFLVTGPTGSGKTTTLYSCLQQRDATSEKLITVEDPVEYQLSNVTQVPVNAQLGVSFAVALRSILRQDPDVLMIGELRDRETAEIAVQAAMTGHMVFATLHTNDAIGAMPRLMDLGIPPYLIAATLECVLSQRLVRRTCLSCRSQHPPSSELASLASRVLGVTLDQISEAMHHLVSGAGCPVCRETGYRGRTGLFELLVIDDTMKEAIARGASHHELRRLADHAGRSPMQLDAWSKATMGVTTLQEVVRVLQT